VQAVAGEGGRYRGPRRRHHGRERLLHPLKRALALDEAVLVETVPAHDRTVPHAATRRPVIYRRRPAQRTAAGSAS
jgi:hypothetical protein